MPPAIRSTQRAPLSCTACCARKVKCSKDIPCRPCISRGTALDCRREIVRVRGQLRTADSSSANPTYETLLQENARLSALLAAPDAQYSDTSVPQHVVIDMTQQYERRLVKTVGQSTQPRTVFQDAHIRMPAIDCSHSLVRHAKLWTSWIHFAFFFPDFEDEHTKFWERFSFAPSFECEDTLWLSIYFSILASTLLFMDEAEFMRSEPPSIEQETLLRNWYHSALYFLDKGDFMQKPSLSVVQAIAILGIVATNIGDTCRHSLLWACALRIAQQLNLGSDRANRDETVVQRECRRRLWWTLVLCEWLPFPSRTPCINETDFDCKLPTDMDDDQLRATNSGCLRTVKNGPRPIQYHIAMSKIAIIFHQLRSKINLRNWHPSEIAQFIFTADEQLASLIGELPENLQNDEPETIMTLERDFANPWIPWQKKSLAMVLLYHRIAINRILQSHWLEGSTNYTRARSICLSSAVAIIKSVLADTVPADFSRMRPWAHAFHIFSGSVTLALEVKGNPEHSSSYLECISDGKEFLRRVESHNVLAKQALEILDELTTT